MNSIYNLDEPPLTEDERKAIRQADAESMRVWKKRALYCTTAFLLSCASVYPFLFGHPLHAYWEHFGKYLVLMSMALLIPFVGSVGTAVNWWIYLRRAKKIKM
jgi:hypothetical protein